MMWNFYKKMSLLIQPDFIDWEDLLDILAQNMTNHSITYVQVIQQYDYVVIMGDFITGGFEYSGGVFMHPAYRSDLQDLHIMEQTE